jgi:hypothetical protein
MDLYVPELSACTNGEPRSIRSDAASLAAMQVPAEQFRIDPQSSSSATTLLGETR